MSNGNNPNDPPQEAMKKLRSLRELRPSHCLQNPLLEIQWKRF